MTAVLSIAFYVIISSLDHDTLIRCGPQNSTE